MKPRTLTPAHVSRVSKNILIIVTAAFLPTLFFAYAQSGIRANSDITKGDDCTLEGQSVRAGTTVTAFSKRTVEYGAECPSIQRVCTDGELTGNPRYRFKNCTQNQRRTTTVSSGGASNSVGFSSQQAAPLFDTRGSLTSGGRVRQPIKIKLSSFYINADYFVPFKETETSKKMCPDSSAPCVYPVSGSIYACTPTTQNYCPAIEPNYAPSNDGSNGNP